MTPVQLFLALEDWEKREDVWKEMTKGETLFLSLYQLVHENKLPLEARLWVEECWEYVFDSKTQHQWELAYLLTWCAQEAVSRPAFYRDEISRAGFEMGDVPAIIQPQKKRAWDCVRTFLNTDNQPKAVLVPIALFNMEEKRGFLATLILETLQPGANQVLHHPADIFETTFNQEFETSIEDAWEAAKTFRPTQNANSLEPRSSPNSDGRWRLLDMNGKPLTERVDGRSASGAAAWGWYCALTGKVYDPRVIVLAQVDVKGDLSGVDGIAAKVKAIAQDGRFDTIVVASTENKDEAVTTLLNGQNIPLDPKPPDKENPGWKYYITLTDGRVMKVVNLDGSDA